MDARNYIYRMEWADFQLDVILPADGYATSNLPLLDNPEIRTLPYGAITVNTLEWGKYEAVGGLPIGIPNPAVLKLTLDLSLLPADITTVLFEDPAKYPLKDNVESPDVNHCGFEIGKGNRGIVFELTKGTDLIFRGIYVSDGVIKINYTNLIFEIEAKELTKYILDNITHLEGESLNRQALDNAIYEDRVQEKIRATEFEYIFDNKSYRVQSNDLIPEKPRSILSIRMLSLDQFINEIGTEILRRLLRKYAYLFINVKYPDNFKQRTDTNGARGTLIDNNQELLGIVALIYDDKIVGGMLNSVNPDNQNSIYSFYKGGLWDYLRDKCLQTLNSYEFSYGEFLGEQASSLIYPDHSFTYNVNLKYHKFSELILRDDPIKVVTASLYESASDNGDKTYQDVNKYDRSIPGSENEASTTIPVIFNNLPPQLNYRKYDSYNYDLNLPGYVYAREGNKFFNLYYDKDEHSIERIHELSRFHFNFYPELTLTSDDFNSLPYVERTIHNGYLYENIQYMQRDSGIGITIANTLIGLLGKGSNKLNGVEFDLNNDFLYPIGKSGVFLFDFSSFFISVPEDLTRRWMMNSCKIDFMKETAICDFIELNV